ncbi:P antigen family member 2-like isoform X2 [Bos indicus x Bos taurus]|uniref:P antigen family member 2-like isoform X2 n=1 Tax=Bos indicus x Bos taurus TaxID=30522 RepID=UPI000F7D4F05|nr:P antigen family member 2-like isoform X2 [Bos indicus x Bos taurus]
MRSVCGRIRCCACALVRIRLPERSVRSVGRETGLFIQSRFFLTTRDSPGRNMSGQVASKLGPTNQDCAQVDEPVVDQQPSVEQPQQEEPPAEIQDITPRKEEVHGEDPVNRDEEEEKDPFEDSGLEADLQQLALAKTGGEGGDGPDVREEFASNTEPGEMPEAGEGQSFA